VFDLSVLEAYRNDPRYSYATDDIRGQIYIKAEGYESPQFPERDKILLETFGFADDDGFNRAVAVFLRYLADLTPEHQQIWKAKEVAGNYRLHPDYYRTDVVGNMPEAYSIFTVFLTELALINRMADAMGRPHLFREDGSHKPRHFGSLLRSTLAEFNNFVLTLDKLLSDNINREFFAGDVPYESEIERGDGKTIVQQKGSLQILNDWVAYALDNPNPDNWKWAYETLRRVRKLRQMPAHALNEDVFNSQYFKQYFGHFLAKGVHKTGHELVECELTTHSQEHGHDHCQRYPQADACGGSTAAQVPCRIVQHHPRAAGPRQLSQSRPLL
jgi:hypothetical protein